MKNLKSFTQLEENLLQGGANDDTVPDDLSGEFTVKVTPDRVDGYIGKKLVISATTDKIKFLWLFELSVEQYSKFMDAIKQQNDRWLWNR